MTEPQIRRAPRSRGDPEEPDETGSPRILVVDDDVVVRLVLKVSLEAAGYTVVTATNLEDAARQLHAPGGIDILLLDLHLPDGISLELLRRDTVLLDACAVLAMTAHPTEHERRMALRHGAVDYMVKPLRTSSLLRKIDELLRG